MTQSHVVSGLIQKRRELAGKVEHLQDQLRQAVIDLDNIDAAIHIFDATVELEDIRPKPFPPRHQAFKGEVTRIVLETIRHAKQPLTSLDIATRVLAERGLDVNNPRHHKLMVKRTGACLRHWRAKGVVRSFKGSDQFLRWELVR